MLATPWDKALSQLRLPHLDSLFCNPPFDREAIERVSGEVRELVRTQRVRVAFVIVPFGPRYRYLQCVVDAVEPVPLYSAVLSQPLSFVPLPEDHDPDYGTRLFAELECAFAPYR
jgi:hypothetical protein